MRICIEAFIINLGRLNRMVTQWILWKLWNNIWCRVATATSSELLLDNYTLSTKKWIFCKRNDLYFRIEIEKNDWIVVKIERIESYRLWSRQLLQRKANLKSSSLVSMQLSCLSLSSQTWCRGFSAIQCSDLLQLPCRQNQVVKFPFRWKCPSKFAKTNSHRLQFCVSF